MLLRLAFPSALILVSHAILTASILASPAFGDEAVGRPPHVVVIVADDLGWNDVAHHGSEIETPALDALVARGAELDRFYVNPSCSPTRASLLTGQFAMRLGVLRPLSKNNPTGLPLDRRLLPELLRDAGYQTALAGKWHLGYLKRPHHPNARGFDSFYGHVSGGVGYWDHVHGGGYDWQRDGVTVREDGYTTHLIAAEAERVIAERDPTRPLFLYVAFNAPHLPNEAPSEALDRYAHIENPHRRAHAAMVSEMDAGIARVVAALEAAGMTDDTLVWFTSDNGGLNPDVAPEPYKDILSLAQRWLGDPPPTRILRFLKMNIEEGAADNRPFRAGKQSVYEGGVRVPAVVAWPGHIPAGRVDARVTITDVMPTVLEAAGVPLPEGQAVDGQARLDVLSGRESPAPAPDYATISQDGEAFYRGDWKLVQRTSGETELYDVVKDPTETRDVAASHAEIVDALGTALADVPRGEDVSLPIWRIVFDPDEFGGEERATPMADRTRD